ncbi:hypothetical protein E2986_12368 [Frieseomelitta varia]|uniref:Uncharacterized protein n=1 Tax=Frieseomelitta varia TaxID=561572 RepID=A0A833RE34_9HYME|nr:hypothetical protein E2986_12368 [Frieseomelitta varia]
MFPVEAMQQFYLNIFLVQQIFYELFDAVTRLVLYFVLKDKTIELSFPDVGNRLYSHKRPWHVSRRPVCTDRNARMSACFRNQERVRHANTRAQSATGRKMKEVKKKKKNLAPKFLVNFSNSESKLERVFCYLSRNGITKEKLCILISNINADSKRSRSEEADDLLPMKIRIKTSRRNGGANQPKTLPTVSSTARWKVPRVDPKATESIDKMKYRRQSFIVLFVLSGLATPRCSSEEITLRINLEEPVAVTDEKFLSLTIDPVTLLAGNALSTDFERSINLARALSPAYLRFGGPRNSLYYFTDPNSQDADDERKIVSGELNRYHPLIVSRYLIMLEQFNLNHLKKKVIRSRLMDTTVKIAFTRCIYI